MSTALRTYWRGATLAAMQDHVAGVTRTYHLDHQGTVQCLTDDNGVVTDRFSCDAWGNEFRRTGTSINRHWYIGHLGYYRQVDQALDYVRARYLSDATGRWLSVDPLNRRVSVRGRAATSHLQSAYGYGASRPASLVDPAGLAPKVYCGPEISCQLRRVLRAVSRTFTAWPDAERIDACDSLVRLIAVEGIQGDTANNTWDVRELYEPPGNTPIAIVSTVQMSGCGRIPCFNTVSVDKACHNAWAVNYSLFGLMFRLCRNGYPLHHIVAHRIEYGDLGAPLGGPFWTNEQIRTHTFSEERAVWLATAWKIANARMNPGAGYKMEHAAMAEKWTRVGYNRWDEYKVPTPAGTHPGCPVCPNHQIKANFSAFWNFHEIQGDGGPTTGQGRGARG